MSQRKMASSWHDDVGRHSSQVPGTDAAAVRPYVRANRIGIAIGDATGHVHDANDAYLDMHGYVRDELSEINWIAHTPHDWKSKTVSAVTGFTPDQLSATFETEHFHKDGRRIPLSITMMHMTGSSFLLCTIVETSGRASRSMNDPRSAYFQAKQRFGLTDREHEVLASLLDGLSNAEISTTLLISLGTVSDHVQSVMRKLKVKNRSRIFKQMLLEPASFGGSFVKGSHANVTMVTSSTIALTAEGAIS